MDVIQLTLSNDLFVLSCVQFLFKYYSIGTSPTNKKVKSIMQFEFSINNKVVDSSLYHYI